LHIDLIREQELQFFAQPPVKRTPHREDSLKDHNDSFNSYNEEYLDSSKYHSLSEEHVNTTTDHSIHPHTHTHPHPHKHSHHQPLDPKSINITDIKDNDITKTQNKTDISDQGEDTDQVHIIKMDLDAQSNNIDLLNSNLDKNKKNFIKENKDNLKKYFSSKLANVNNVNNQKNYKSNNQFSSLDDLSNQNNQNNQSNQGNQGKILSTKNRNPSYDKIKSKYKDIQYSSRETSPLNKAQPSKTTNTTNTSQSKSTNPAKVTPDRNIFKARNRTNYIKQNQLNIINTNTKDNYDYSARMPNDTKRTDRSNSSEKDSVLKSNKKLDMVRIDSLSRNNSTVSSGLRCLAQAKLINKLDYSSQDEKDRDFKYKSLKKEFESQERSPDKEPKLSIKSRQLNSNSVKKFKESEAKQKYNSENSDNTENSEKTLKSINRPITRSTNKKKRDASNSADSRTDSTTKQIEHLDENGQPIKFIKRK